MACCSTGGGKPNPEDVKANRKIEKMLREEAKRMKNEVKLLLLGTGESGKSTIAKQMKIIHLNGFTDEEKSAAKPIIYHNVVTSMKALLHAAKENNVPLLPQNKDAEENLPHAEYFSGPLPPDVYDYVKRLWADPGIKAMYERGNEFNIIDSAAYFFDGIDKLSSQDYHPSEQDVLRARSKTTGVKETQFEVEGLLFRVVDVGGQRSERRKWAQCFEDVTAVLFCIALSEYDMHLAEDSSTNRMHESLQIFKEVCNSRWFLNTPVIIFFNKKDIFAEKIRKTDLNVCFPDYKGGKDFDKATTYIREQFSGVNENPKKPIYPHVTCATDTNNINVVFRAVKDIVMDKIFQTSGIAY